MRIGVQIGPYDPFWVEVREAVYLRAQQFGPGPMDVDLIPIEVAGSPDAIPSLEQDNLLEELLAQNLDALICWNLPDKILERILGNRIPAIYLAESQIAHPLFVTPTGLYDAGAMVGRFLANRLQGNGRILCIGGLCEEGGENGSSRLTGFRDAVSAHPGIVWRHFPSYWRYDQAYPQIAQAIEEFQRPIDAIFGLSDSLALASRDAAKELGVLDEHVLVAGVNGDPQALAAIADGSFSATVETSAFEFGTRAMELAYQAACGLPLPQHFGYSPVLVTADNVNEAMRRKLTAIAGLPSRLVGVNRRLEQERIAQLETSTAINQRVGALLDRKELCREFAKLIQANYGYDHVQYFVYSRDENLLVLEQTDEDSPERTAPAVDPYGPLNDVLSVKEAVFIPDTRTHTKYAMDPLWPETRSRVILPVRIGNQILGLLDLHSRHFTRHSRTELIGLQTLADQFGVAMRNSELYAEAVESRAIAEKANQLKTRLLANVSHELRAPLNIIMGYSQTALQNPSFYQCELPPQLLQDQQKIYQSSEHLKRVIEDLLDLSRAEIDELNLFPEFIQSKAFLKETFQSMAETSAADVAWNLRLPERLPVLYGDPVRLRQILLNLLSNARKFTAVGSITLGAQVEPPDLHFWLADTGVGIPEELQEEIFKPFVTAGRPGATSEGIGLGLSITRRLVALHGGRMCVESRVGQGSTFHVYLPLPTLTGKSAHVPDGASRSIAVLSANGSLLEELQSLSQTQGVELVHLRGPALLGETLRKTQPCAIALDLGAAVPEDWAIVENLSKLPDFRDRPFLLYGEPAHENPAGHIGVMIKPLNGNTLVEYFRSLRPATGPILIVDDDPEARSLYRGLARQGMPGYEIVEANDGAEALRALDQVTPSLVILDLVMPEVDGFAVLAKLRSLPRTHTVPVMVLSGKSITEEDMRKLDYSRVTFHGKDLFPSDGLVALIRKSLDPEMGFLSRPTSQLVKNAITFLHQNYTRTISRQEVADAVGASENYISHIFLEEVGVSPWEYLNRVRILKAKDALRDTSDSVTTIALNHGFDDSSYFSRVFRKYVGVSPQAFRAQELRQPGVAAPPSANAHTPS